MERAEHVLEVSHLSIRFGRVSVLSDVSFRVPTGTALAVIGPNGAGKTVLFKALIGAIRYEGDIRWEPGTRIGYVPQKLDLERDVPITGMDFLRARAALARESDAGVSRARWSVDRRRRAADWNPVRRAVSTSSRGVRTYRQSDRATPR